MKIVIRELVRCAALIYLLGAPWAIVSSRVEGLGVVLLLAGILPAGSFLLRVLQQELEVQLRPKVSRERLAPGAPEPAHRLRLVSEDVPQSAHRSR